VNFNIKKEGLRNEPEISSEHVKNNRDVRDLLMQRGIQPEALLAAEDIKKVERRLVSETKKIAKKK
jgi:DNA-damage-inducible protein D